MSMKSDLRRRTSVFALAIVRFYVALPKTTEAQILGKQVLRSGTSVGAHYREAYRSRSDAKFISKVEVALQELEETLYWMELLRDSGASGSVSQTQMQDIVNEADQLIAIFTACVKNVKNKKQ